MALSEEVRAKFAAAKSRVQGGNVPAAVKARPGKASAADLREALANRGKPTKVEPDYSDDPEAAARAAEKKRMDEAGEGLSAHTKAWAEKFKKMNDPESWFAVLFDDPAHIGPFVEQFGVAGAESATFSHNGRPYYDGYKAAALKGLDLTEQVMRKPRKLKVSKPTAAEMKRAFQYKPHPSAFADLDYDRPLEQSTQDEIDAVRKYFDHGLSQPWVRKHGDILDSEHWIAFVFGDRDDKEKFLALLDLAEIGDKYIDGNKAAEMLGIDLDAR